MATGCKSSTIVSWRLVGLEGEKSNSKPLSSTALRVVLPLTSLPIVELLDAIKGASSSKMKCGVVPKVEHVQG